MNPAPYRCTLPKLLLNIYEKYYIYCIICDSPILSRGLGKRFLLMSLHILWKAFTAHTSNISVVFHKYDEDK